MSYNNQEPGLLDALIPSFSLIVLLAISVFIFGDGSSSGPNQIALIIATAIAAIIGLKNGYTWSHIESCIVDGVTVSVRAIIVLLMVGALIGSWILSGTVPTIVYFGLEFLNPAIFLTSCCLITALVALSIGSSWTVVGTVGIGLIGIAAGFGLPLDMTAGAIISGAYFGDKMSPLSDTTNLAPAVAGSELFTHIRNMMWTTVPSISLALALFLMLDLSQEGVLSAEQIGEISFLLQNTFTINGFMLLPFFILIFLAYKKMPAIPALFIGILLGVACSLFFQADLVRNLAGQADLPDALLLLKGLWQVLFGGYLSSTGNDTLDALFSRGGMSSMLTTIWLILTAMMFGAVLDGLGLLKRLVKGIVSGTKSTGNLIAVTIASCLGTNILTADQYIAIVLPGRMYKVEFSRRGLPSKTLSRTLEDSATITSPLIPWNTCGAYMAVTLGVGTLAYLPYCFFNLINPVISLLYGYTGFKLYEEGEDMASVEVPAEP